METRSLDAVRIGTRFRKDMGDVQGLAASIREVGLLHPVVIAPDGELIAGARRLAACRLLGWQQVPVRVVDLQNVLRGEYDENAVRKDFLPSEAVAIAKALEPVERAAAKVRADEGRTLGGLVRQGHASTVESFHQAEPAKTRDKVAAYVGISGKTLEKAAAVVQAAEREPEKYAPLLERMDRTGKVDGVFKRLQVFEKAEEIRRETPSVPTGPFRVIVADPPWHYEKRLEDPAHRAVLPYPSMTIEKICALPVRDIAADDAVLWLWTTNAHLRQAFDVVDAWGFEYKTMLTWVKHKMGMGDWLRGQTEHCLMAIRGKPVVVLVNQTTVLHAVAREHSRKPEEFYALVEALCPGSKVELFARTPREGWCVHGNEPTKFRAESGRSA